MLKLEKVTGGYANIPVLKDVTFEVADGELVGLIGLNGAGKSTTINEIIGLLTPYGGQIAIDGLTIQQDTASYRQKIGYIPETPSLYEELTLREHLETVLMAYGLDVTEGMARAEKYLKLFRLDEKLDWFPTQFSKGMKQKVMIICAFIVGPSLLIVDEPFLGLDPLAISDLIELLAEEKRMVRRFSCRLTFWIQLRRCVTVLSSCITVKSWHRERLMNFVRPLVTVVPVLTIFTCS
ncbi:ABC transporter, ATP-binding protein EcsA [Streptococcus sp. HSISS2]|nr:ABC transporter, ATP-binding protein EcsA [Streptococcus sp. HSISS2]